MERRMRAWVSISMLAASLIAAQAGGAAAAPTETILYSFLQSAKNGAQPFARLAIDTKGVLYGTTPLGGAGNFGTVFALTPPAKTGERWTETVLYSFKGGTDGKNPVAGVVWSAGVLYGTAYAGGAHGLGTVFRLVPPAKAGEEWVETPIYSFKGNAARDGANPYGDLILDSHGTLYGTTFYGGEDTANDAAGTGTVFKLVPPPRTGATGTETVLQSFDDHPKSGLTIDNSTGALYGTTVGAYGGGILNPGPTPRGTVFQLSPAPGNTWTLTTLVTFCATSNKCPDGDTPQGTLVFDQGVVYGTSSDNQGGYYNGGVTHGTVFRLTMPTTKGSPWKFTTLYRFKGGADGNHPLGGLIAAGGVLYGTAVLGGANAGVGTVFKLTDAGGSWTETTLHSFAADAQDGAQPKAGLVQSGDVLYGTTLGGGANFLGTVFAVRP
jgi:uncharacterized repeat protein (TIGR03803 family)